MSVNYKKLWKLMIDKNLSKTELTHLAGISTNAMAKLGRNEDVRVNVLEMALSPLPQRDGEQIPCSFLWKHLPLPHCSCTTLLIVDLSFGVQPFHHCLSNLFDDTGAPVWRLNLHKSNAANERLADGLKIGRNGPWR